MNALPGAAAGGAPGLPRLHFTGPFDRCGTAPRAPCRFNTGGPSSRVRKERIASTLLGRGDGLIDCPSVVRIALDFGADDPLEVMRAILAEEGYGGAEDLKGEFEHPPGRLIRRPWQPAKAADARTLARRALLRDALILGLTTEQVYDPARPVLWTSRSLTRPVELFDPRGFYA